MVCGLPKQVTGALKNFLLIFNTSHAQKIKTSEMKSLI